MLPFLWPKERPFIKVMFVTSVVALLCSKLCNVASPIALKYAIDAVVDGEFSVGAILAYGPDPLRRVSVQRDQGQRVRVRLHARVPENLLRTFTHVMSLSLRFHISRKTGSVIRVLARLRELRCAPAVHLVPGGAHIPGGGDGVRVPVDFLLVVLWRDHVHGHLRVAAFTIPFTEWRNKFRREQTQADDVFNQKATDSLLNYETVKLFCARAAHRARVRRGAGENAGGVPAHDAVRSRV